MKTQTELFKTYGNSNCSDIKIQLSLDEEELYPGVTTNIYINVMMLNDYQAPISQFYLTEQNNFKIIHNGQQLCQLIQCQKLGQLKTLITGSPNGKNLVQVLYKQKVIKEQRYDSFQFFKINQNCKVHKNTIILRESGILEAQDIWKKDQSYQINIRFTSSAQAGFKGTQSDKLFVINVGQGLCTIKKVNKKLFVNQQEIIGLEGEDVYVVCKVKSMRQISFEK